MTLCLRRNAAFLAFAFAAFAAAASAQPKAATLTPDHLKGFEFRNIGPAIMGGRIDDFAVVESRTRPLFYVGDRRGRNPGRRSTTASPRSSRSSTTRWSRRSATSRSHRPTRRSSTRDRRAEQPPVVVLGQRRLQVARRRQDAGAPRARGDAPHRPHGRAPDESRRRLRRGARAALGAEQGARALPDDGRRQDLDRTRSSSTRTPASSTWRSIPRARDRSTPRPTSGGARRSASTAADPAARSGRPSTAGRDLDEAHEGPPPEGEIGRIGRRGLRARAATSSTRSSSTPRRAGVYRSEDSGDTWKQDVRHQPAAVLLQPGPDRSGERPRVWVLGASTVPLGGRRQDLPTGRRSEDPRRLPRALDRSRELRPHAGRERRRRSTSPTTAAAAGTS